MQVLHNLTHHHTKPAHSASHTTAPHQKVALVTGANGFIGFAVAKALCANGYRVYGLVRSQDWFDKLSLEEITPVQGTIEDWQGWVKSLAHEQFDAIVSTTEQISNGDAHTQSILDLISALSDQNKGKVPHVIYTSGIKIYEESGLANDPSFHIITEDSPLSKSLPVLSYRIRAVKELSNNKKVHLSVIIPSMVYGRSQSWYGPLIYPVLTQEKDKIIVIGSPDTAFHGVHVDDLAQAYVLVLNKGETTYGQSYNVSGDNFETYEHLFGAISHVLGGFHEFEYVQPNQNSQLEIASSYSQWIDSSKIRKLGWQPYKPAFTASAAQHIAAFRSALKDPVVNKPIAQPIYKTK